VGKGWSRLDDVQGDAAERMLSALAACRWLQLGLLFANPFQVQLLGLSVLIPIGVYFE
jgi:hypothetical protein